MGSWDSSTKILVPYVVPYSCFIVRFDLRKNGWMKKQRIHQIVFLGMIVTQNQNVNRKFIQVGESEILINSQRIISHSRLDYKKTQES